MLIVKIGRRHPENKEGMGINNLKIMVSIH